MSDKYEKLATKIGAIVDIKQKAYGNSFGQAGAFLELLYPDGIPVKAYTDALCIVRIWDKLKRLSNLGILPSNEGKLDAWQDIVGYGLLGLQKDQILELPEEAEEEKGTVKDPTALELRQLTEKRLKDAEPEAKNAKAHLADVEEYANLSEPVIRCAICQNEFRNEIPYAAALSGNPIVHEECYRERFAKSPE